MAALASGTVEKTMVKLKKCIKQGEMSEKKIDEFAETLAELLLRGSYGKSNSDKNFDPFAYIPSDLKNELTKITEKKLKGEGDIAKIKKKEEQEVENSKQINNPVITSTTSPPVNVTIYAPRDEELQELETDNLRPPVIEFTIPEETTPTSSNEPAVKHEMIKRINNEKICKVELATQTTCDASVQYDIPSSHEKQIQTEQPSKIITSSEQLSASKWIENNLIHSLKKKQQQPATPSKQTETIKIRNNIDEKIFFHCQLHAIIKQAQELTQN